MYPTPKILKPWLTEAVWFQTIEAGHFVNVTYKKIWRCIKPCKTRWWRRKRRPSWSWCPCPSFENLCSIDWIMSLCTFSLLTMAFQIRVTKSFGGKERERATRALVAWRGVRATKWCRMLNSIRIDAIDVRVCNLLLLGYRSASFPKNLLVNRSATNMKFRFSYFWRSLRASRSSTRIRKVCDENI